MVSTTTKEYKSNFTLTATSVPGRAVSAKISMFLCFSRLHEVGSLVLKHAGV